ncbi:penicillin-binding protein 2 [Polynucleobacter sp. 30F-ANTBAC]|uniref:penicillin-binding protein 2 n=1 Tax=Polynucleobacter sp. 30F-ANTBAC TaxID=2689095 RepID=UPI001C0AEDA7|nr:penicillin-binding protein 2 [Polynucleobacter sp. 30F-ANTBAC]
MHRFNKPQPSVRSFQERLSVAMVFVLICFAILLARFVWLQVVTHHRHSVAAENNRIALIPIAANRGLITDRNGIVIARNYSAYTLEITPSLIEMDVNTLLDQLSEVVDIQAKDRRNFLKLFKESKTFDSFAIRTLLTDAEVAKFTAQRYRFQGVDIQARLFRQYPYGELGSHLIGYIGRVSQRDREKLIAELDSSKSNEEDWEQRKNINLLGMPYIGKVGIEQSYEQALRGSPGFEQVEITAGGRAVRTLSTSSSTPGKNLVLSVDIKLQSLVEDLYGKRRGAFVAIEPQTGDILAFVSKPNFNPNDFIEGIDATTWKNLNESLEKPLYNRPLKGIYSPGSTYKPFMALAALETGKRAPNQSIVDPGYFNLGNHTFRDDKVGGHGTVDMAKSIVESCNTYYYQLSKDMGVNLMHDFMKPLGFGQITGIDLIGESRGVLPSTDWKERTFKKPEQQKWFEGETISLGIGQGYNNFTILQLAHATANLANQGVVMKPHLVKSIEDPVSREKIITVSKESYKIDLKKENIDVVTNAMVDVNRFGTSAAAFKGAGYNAAGKTGTAQVYSLNSKTYNHGATPEMLRDHALYVVFAPAENPKIAIAMVVENAGFGAAHAAPIARKALDYYLEGRWPKEVPEWKNAP